MSQKAILHVNGRTYRLVGVVVHVVLAQGLGHYTAFIRSKCDGTQWFYADDTKVYSIQVTAISW